MPSKKNRTTGSRNSRSIRFILLNIGQKNYSLLSIPGKENLNRMKIPVQLMIDPTGLIMAYGLIPLHLSKRAIFISEIEYMDFRVVIIFCIVQILILMSILSIKRFRNYVNLFLGAILVVLLLKFCYYLISFNGVFEQGSYMMYTIRFLQAMPPPILWFYSSAIISGSIILRKRMLLHGLPLLLGFVAFTPLLLKAILPGMLPWSLTVYNKWFGLVFSELGAVLFIVYSQMIFKNLYKIYGANRSLLSCMLDFSYQHLTLLKVLSIMMNVYALILIFGGFIDFASIGKPSMFDYIDSGFLILLSYLMIFILVATPKVIHYKYSTLAHTDKLLKYEKSTLSRSEAMVYMREMNKWMETERPYLKSDLSLGDLTERMHLPGHIISEVLNGLLKQNFYDYINNYRIEEFKKLVSLPQNSKYTNLALAFESGFNSKTTFNTAFKKFTGKTPSQFRAGLNQ